RRRGRAAGEPVGPGGVGMSTFHPGDLAYRPVDVIDVRGDQAKIACGSGLDWVDLDTLRPAPRTVTEWGIRFGSGEVGVWFQTREAAEGNMAVIRRRIAAGIYGPAWYEPMRLVRRDVIPTQH